MEARRSQDSRESEKSTRYSLFSQSDSVSPCLLPYPSWQEPKDGARMRDEIEGEVKDGWLTPEGNLRGHILGLATSECMFTVDLKGKQKERLKNSAGQKTRQA